MTLSRGWFARSKAIVVLVIKQDLHQENVQKLLDFFAFSSEKVKKRKSHTITLPNNRINSDFLKLFALLKLFQLFCSIELARARTSSYKFKKVIVRFPDVVLRCCGRPQRQKVSQDAF